MKRTLVFVVFLLVASGTAFAGPWTFEYAQDVGERNLGVAVYAEDDFATSLSHLHAYGGPFELQWYHSAPGTVAAYSCMETLWVDPGVGPSVRVNYPFGIGIEYSEDRYIYMANDDDSNSVLVWDYNCNEVDRLELGNRPGTSDYSTACDLDADGNVYVAMYAPGLNPLFPAVSIYPPRGTWVNHKAPMLTSIASGAFVNEGMCVNAAGTVVWITNRSASGSSGWAKRWTGNVTDGFTEDIGFACSVPGFVRAIDVDEDNNRIFICCDTNGNPINECIIIANATTGAHIETLYTDPGEPYHVSPYDVEWDPVGNDLYIVHHYGWFVAKWHEQPAVAVTMSSFTATSGEMMVELSWKVESEVDNAGFKIYRDGEEIAFVQSQGNTDAPRTYTWIDRNVTPNATYLYKIADVSLDGQVTTHDFEATATPMATSVPTEYSLSQNYPNPFNADTHIEFKLANAGYTTLRIYNTTGQLVRILVDEHLDASVHKVRWDGRNDSGKLVSSGVYFYRLASGSFIETKKMTFLR